MSTVIEAPVAMIEQLAALRLPPRTDRRLQRLMDRNTNGLLTPAERDELEDLAELSEVISLMRAEALQLLGKKPQ
jgi:hypothetical protein